MSMSRQQYETLEGQSFAGVRQLSVFLENRLGQLLRLTQIIEHKEVKILGISVLDSIDHAVVRLLCNDPDDAIDVLKGAGFAVSIADDKPTPCPLYPQ